jgi:LmbE family N-acetylglucosaminyl deacetylase
MMFPAENIIWLGYDDGDLEYVDARKLRGQAARLIKKYRPDALFTIDPGTNDMRWHKTDHRMAAFVTKDAFIASEWPLYYPQHLKEENLKPYRVPLAFYYYTIEPNYKVDITDVVETKVKASAKHVSQFPPSVEKYTPEMSAFTFQMLRMGGLLMMRDGSRYVEKFRREPNP